MSRDDRIHQIVNMAAACIYIDMTSVGKNLAPGYSTIGPLS